MSTETSNLLGLPIEFLQLRVLIWKEDDYYIAQCLETGSITTADDFHTLRNMMYTLLIDEHDFNTYGEGSLRNLFDTPAPMEVWIRYYQLISNRNADYISGITMLDASY